VNQPNPTAALPRAIVDERDTDIPGRVHLPGADGSNRATSRTGGHSQALVLLLAASAGLQRADEHLRRALDATEDRPAHESDDLGEHTVQ